MRLKWLDGIKGIACFAVLWHHFMLAFYPGQYNGLMPAGIIDPVQTPLSFIINGNFMVCIFMVVSGVVASRSLMYKQGNTSVISMLPQRYLRLVIPVIPFSLLVVLFSNTNIFYNSKVAALTNSSYLASWFSQPVKLIDALASTLYRSFISTDTVVSGIFWVFPYFLWGFLLAAAFAIVLKKKNKPLIVLYVGIAAVIVYFNIYFAAFILGSIISSLFKSFEFDRKNLYLTKLIGIFTVVIGLILGGYPSGVTPSNFYKYFPDFKVLSFPNYVKWHILGALLLVVGVWLLAPLRDLFGNKFFQGLGKISYEVFILHMLVLCTFSCIVFELCLSLTDSYTIASFITFCLTNVVVYFLAYGYHIVVSKFMKIVLKRR